MTPPVRATQLGVHYRRNEFVVLLDALRPARTIDAENVALYILVCIFWGSILYFALAALQ